MKEQVTINKPALKQDKTTNLMGFYASITLTIITIITFGLALRAVPISGANAPGGGLAYPYLDTLKQYPRDYMWMFVAMILVLTYVVVMITIHSSADSEKKIYSQIGVTLAIIAAAVLLIDYYVQIAVVPVSLMNNETEGITLITQYNPHGIFIALEELGYIVMNLSFLFMGLVFGKSSRLEGFMKWIFVVPLPISIIYLALISIQFGINRQDRFEVIVLSVAWLVMIINGILLSLFFRKKLKKS